MRGASGADRSRRRQLWGPARALLLGGLLWALAAAASAIPLVPGQSVEIDFSLAGPGVVTIGGMPPTVLDADAVTIFLSVQDAVGLTGYSVELFDGATSLGSDTTPVRSIWGFVDGSLWNLGAIAADLSSVVDGSIDGRLVMTPLFDATPGAGLDVLAATPNVGYANAANSLLPIDQIPVVGPVRVVPEPDLLGLLGLAGLWLAGSLGRARTR